MPEKCPHGNTTITGGGPYYRQVHPNNFQEGRVLSKAFVSQNTGCHLTLSHREFTAKGGRLSAAVVSISTDELAESGAERVADLWETYNHRDGFAGARHQYEAELLNYKRLNHGDEQALPVPE